MTFHCYVSSTDKEMGREAWFSLKGLDSEEAKEKYLKQLVRILRRFQDRPKVLELIQSLQGFLYCTLLFD